MQEIEKWISPANEAVKIQLVASSGTTKDFAPAITESIYLHDDQIIGYKDPEIKLKFRANDLLPSVRIKYRQKAPKDLISQIKGGDELFDLEAPLKGFFPVGAFTTVSEDVFTQSQAGWTPPGERLHLYKHDGTTYEIWAANLGDARAIEILKNMKIFIPMFIEGGTVDFLNDDDVPENRWTIERWTLFLLYEVNIDEYSLAGFSTSYHLPVFPSHNIIQSLPTVASAFKTEPREYGELAAAITQDTTISNSNHTAFSDKSISEYPARERISQFIILPPYQGCIHGIKLYNTITARFLADPYIFQITVEDPNENFDNLRDYCDLARLLADPAFADLRLPSSIPPNQLYSDAPVPITTFLATNTIPELCQRHKLITRQVQRLIEIHLLRTIPESSRSVARIVRKGNTSNEDDRKFYYWRLLVKHRVWMRNHEELAQIDENDRVSKIESATDAMFEQYLELSDGFDRRIREGLLVRESAGANASPQTGDTAAIKYSGRKRKVVADEEESNDSDEAPAKRQATEELLGSVSKHIT